MSLYFPPFPLSPCAVCVGSKRRQVPGCWELEIAAFLGDSKEQKIPEKKKKRKDRKKKNRGRLVISGRGKRQRDEPDDNAAQRATAPRMCSTGAMQFASLTSGWIWRTKLIELDFIGRVIRQKGLISRSMKHSMMADKVQPWDSDDSPQPPSRLPSHPLHSSNFNSWSEHSTLHDPAPCVWNSSTELGHPLSAKFGRPVP
ncbi:hypothetical protein HDK90DRAFT_306503 [Phyllosticta capitalensis]|uniref:Uncharacterized protein n=1 Tax=Phyllosticta capitalensis TaxID=121624 RepID=A0ABR1YKM6_9PEZI